MRDQSKPAPGSKEVDFALLDDETLDVSKLADFLKKVNKPSALINETLLKTNKHLHNLISLTQKVAIITNILLTKTSASISLSRAIIYKIAVAYPLQPVSQVLRQLTLLLRYQQIKIDTNITLCALLKSLSAIVHTIQKLLVSLLERIRGEGAEFRKKSAIYLLLTNQLVDEEWAKLIRAVTAMTEQMTKVEKLEEGKGWLEEVRDDLDEETEEKPVDRVRLMEVMSWMEELNLQTENDDEDD